MRGCAARLLPQNLRPFPQLLGWHKAFLASPDSVKELCPASIGAQLLDLYSEAALHAACDARTADERQQEHSRTSAGH